MTAEREQELLAAIAKGTRAHALLVSECWTKDIVGYLTTRENDLSKGSSWKPGGSADVGTVAMGCAYNGGRQDECINLWNQLTIWEDQGQVAAVKLEQERKK